MVFELGKGSFFPFPEKHPLKLFFLKIFIGSKDAPWNFRETFGVTFKIQGHLGVGNAKKHPLEQNCPKADAAIKGEYW